MGVHLQLGGEEMMNEFFPYQIVRAVPYENGLCFLKQDKRVSIKNKDMADIVWKILEFCDGKNDISKIAELTEVGVETTKKYIDDLRHLGVVMDSRELFMYFHDISNFPAPFNHKISFSEIESMKSDGRVQNKSGEILKFCSDDASTILEIAQKRASVRCFSDNRLTIDQIGSICSNSYSLTRHICPSGGGLYPLHLYVIVTKDQIGIPVGYYEFAIDQNCLIRYEDTIDIEQLKYCFNSSTIPFNSGVQVIIAGELKRQPKKYSNRGYRLTLIEVGHVAQNMNLYCTERGIGVCELGGLLDEPLKKELKLPHDIYPILGLAVGYREELRDTQDEIRDSGKLKFIEDELMCKNALIKSSSTIYSKEFGSFFGATVQYGNDFQMAGATSPSYCDALFKASIEAYERNQTKNISSNIKCSALELGNTFIDPRVITPLDSEQLQRCRLTPFTDDLVIDWVKGESSVTGETVMVPRDMVVYGKESNTTPIRICWSSSSGVAAWTNIVTAREKALLELIERDALMRCWFHMESPAKLPPDNYPLHVKRKQLILRQEGFNLELLKLKSDYGLVVLAIIFGDKYPFFVCGASAGWSANSLESICLKAEQEAEYRLISELKRNNLTHAPDREAVVTPLDHGRFYCYKPYANKLMWLTCGKEEDTILLSKPIEYNALLSELDVVWVDIPGPVKDIKVVRAFSPKLVPMSFGYWNSYYLHQSLGKVDRPNDPHFFA